MLRTITISAVSFVIYIALTIPTVLTLNNLINRSQENRLNVQRADINELKTRVDRLQLLAGQP